MQRRLAGLARPAARRRSRARRSCAARRRRSRAAADAAGARAAVARGAGHDTVGVAGQDPDRRLDRAAVERQLGDLGDVRRSRSARSLTPPSSAAVFGLTSAALSQVSLVSGFGSSCSQPLLAKRPSQTVGSGRNATSSPAAPARRRRRRPRPRPRRHHGRFAGTPCPATTPSCSARSSASRSRPRRAPLAPVRAHDVVALGVLGASTKAASTSSADERVVERRDQRLDDRHRAVAARASPQLSSECAAGTCQWQRAGASRRRRARGGRGAAPCRAPRRTSRSAGARVDRVRAEDHQQLDLARAASRRRAPASAAVSPPRLRLGGGGVADGRAHGAERLVDRVGERVDGRRLALAGEHERSARRRASGPSTTGATHGVRRGRPRPRARSSAASARAKPSTSELRSARRWSADAPLSVGELSTT